MAAQKFSKMNLTSHLKGEIGEIIYTHYCQKQKGERDFQFAYLSSEEIHSQFLQNKKRTNLLFKYGQKRIKVNLPKEIRHEILETAKPKMSKQRTTFTFDYLSVSLNGSYIEKKDEFLLDFKKGPTKKAFCWIDVKTGNSGASGNQKNTAKKSKIKFAVVKVRFSKDLNIEINFRYFKNES